MGSSEHHPVDDKFEAISPMQQAIRWFREKVAGRPEGNIRDMIAEVLEEESGTGQGLSAEEKKLLHNMIHFGELTVSDIMVPRTDIMAVSSMVTLEELQRHVIDIGHTRIPIYEKSLDKVIGFIHVKDLFPYAAAKKPFEIVRVMREIIFVPPSMRIVDLLMKMRVSGCHIAIVVDEYGGTDGMVTMEDLFEELVGEIQDEHDGVSSKQLKWIGDHVLETDARVSVEEVEEALGHLLTENKDVEYDTLGGFIFTHLGRVPVRGEIIKLSPQLRIEILAADPRRIRHVRLTRS